MPTMPRTRCFSLLAAVLLAAAGAPAPAAAQSAMQDPRDMVAAAESFLREQVADLPGDPVISVQPPARGASYPACDSLTPFLSGGSRLRPRMSVGLRCSSPSAWTAYLQAAVSVQGQYYVAARTINPGEALTEDALAPRSGDLVTLPPGTVTRPADVQGQVASQRIASGQPVRASALRSADAVLRGQTVRIVARGPGFQVSSEGQAMEPGAPGKMIQVRTASGQIVTGVVLDAQTVQIPM